MKDGDKKAVFFVDGVLLGLTVTGVYIQAGFGWALITLTTMLFLKD